VKEDCILAGVELAEIIFKTFDKNLNKRFTSKTVNRLKRRYCFCSHRKSTIYSFHRTIGIELYAKNEWYRYHDSRLEFTFGRYKTQLLDTRKTTPNFRLCEKWAVVIGGGTNHRYGLYDMIMLKDNHIDYNGNITQAVKMAKII
jgi:nicotinate-nucleotide pyrophosphorylase (carboxylating)